MKLRRFWFWMIIGLVVVAVFLSVYHSRQSYATTRDWFENRNDLRLTAMMLKIGASIVLVKNTNVLTKIDSEIAKKAFCPGPDTTVVNARLELNGEWRGWIVVSCNYDAGTLVIGIPEKFSLFPVECEYATIRISPTNLYYLNQVIGAAYRLAE
jgi:hypothetical protein